MTAPRSLLPIGIVLLLWNMMGVGAFIMQYTADLGQLAKTDPYTARTFAAMPAWLWAIYAVAVGAGTLGAMLEMTAIFHLLWETETPSVPKIVNITVDYLRSAGPRDVIAAAKVTKQGRRMVNVFIEAWQDDRSRPVATAQAHFLVKSDDEPPAL